MFTSNYFYDLPKELQQKTLMTCIEIEIKERIAQRVENIKDNIEYKEIFTRIFGFQDTYGLISYTKNDLYWSHNKHTMIVQLLKI